MTRIIPAIDLIEGKCVRLSQGAYDQKVIYSNSPVDVAKRFEDHGIQYLHLVDLEGAKAKSPKNLYVLEQIALRTGLKIDFGGGIKSEEDLVRVFNSGACQANIGSLAVLQPKLVTDWLNTLGNNKIIIGSDVKDGYIYTNGWKVKSDKSLVEFVQMYVDLGAKYFVCTDIHKDGMLSGSSKSLYKDLLGEFADISLIASGGVHELDEVWALQKLGVEGIIIGKAFYEGTIKLKDIKHSILKSNNLC